MEKNQSYKTIDEYIAHCPVEIQNRLKEVRKVIKEIVPDAEERISYQMPAFFQNGVLVYFGAQKNHLGFYPTGSGVEHFKSELGGYSFSKGAIQFPYDKPLPVELIQRITRFRLEENLKKDKSYK